MEINSVIFHTVHLKEVRAFYEGLLGLKVGTYEKDGAVVPDCSDTYVNFDLKGVLLCFESTSSGQADQGTVVLDSAELNRCLEGLRQAGHDIKAAGSGWAKVKDPEGRTIILEQRTDG